jgi:hypothetical protein
MAPFSKQPLALLPFQHGRARRVISKAKIPPNDDNAARMQAQFIDLDVVGAAPALNRGDAKESRNDTALQDGDPA